MIPIPLIAAAVLSTVTAAVRIAARWLDGRHHLLQLRELSRCDHVRSLPAGSRIVDLGASAIVIQVGESSRD